MGKKNAQANNGPTAQLNATQHPTISKASIFGLHGIAEALA